MSQSFFLSVPKFYRRNLVLKKLKIKRNNLLHFFKIIFLKSFTFFAASLSSCSNCQSVSIFFLLVKSLSFSLDFSPPSNRARNWNEKKKKSDERKKEKRMTKKCFFMLTFHIFLQIVTLRLSYSWVKENSFSYGANVSVSFIAKFAFLPT